MSSSPSIMASGKRLWAGNDTAWHLRVCGQQPAEEQTCMTDDDVYCRLHAPGVFVSTTEGGEQVMIPLEGSSTHWPPEMTSSKMGPCTLRSQKCESFDNLQ